jgi:preprotein translocase subunit SecD
MSLRTRTVLSVAVVLLIGFFAVANFVPQEQRVESPLLPDSLLRLGLDLQGGFHWVLGAKLDEAEVQELGSLRTNLTELAEEEGFAIGSTRVEGTTLVINAPTSDAATWVREWAADLDDTLTTVSDDGVQFVYVLTDFAAQNVRDRGMLQVLEVLRRRIADPIQGIPDSVVTRQGDDRILVQIPGGQISRERALLMLEVTGHLEFRIVRDSAASRELLEAKYVDGFPPDQSIAYERDRETDRVVQAYLLDTEPGITGDYLTDARLAFDRQQRAIVSFTFNADGGRRFADFTQAHLQEPMAIVLDDVVYSAPIIRSRIGSRGQIEGRFTSEEAADLAVVLRSGSLPIPVEIEEERTVGPALGKDSIERGQLASLLGLAIIVLMVCFYYRRSGVYASTALAANLLLLMGMMSLFEATLTLPGIAGIVLTVGMAVDANVIIFERIREELRTSKTPRAAIATGFNKAFWTILDANITTLITALVLFEYGTGPIKGFAVTLSVGIVTSVFAALVLTRLMFALYPGNRPVESLSI